MREEEEEGSGSSDEHAKEGAGGKEGEETEAGR